ncbi:hypothetical protein [Candidatus Magnetominusculus dajiuhuensis]|uniref:hypothetical protein n=1 Tax=Candidatus Magnetominusculus dajiuhuensis TaxID=3137712 RepID=UPI003B43848A
MADTCWIKDEHGRFQGRRPGCKMEKADGGVLPVSDSAGDNAAEVEDNKGVNITNNDSELEKRIRKILSKPKSKWTKEDNELIAEYLRAKAAEIGKQWKNAVLTMVLTLMFGAESVPAILAAMAMGIALDELMKYAEEKFPGYGALGVMLAAAVLIAAKGKLNAQAAAKADEKAAAAVVEEKAAAEEAAAEKAAVEKKAAEEAAKSSEKIGGIYDETANGSSLSKSDPEKEANKITTGDIKANQAKTLNEQAEKAGSSTRFDGYTTEASQATIEHSIRGHSDAKVEIAKEREAQGYKVSPQDKIPEEQRKGQGGKSNVPLTKGDYQNIPKYREEAIDKGRVVFQPINGNKLFETVEFQVPQSDGVIHMIYRVDRVNNKMTFVTMYKVGYRKPPASR